MCRSTIANKVTDCQDPILNPPYPGRKGPSILWDKKCTKSITLDFENGKDLTDLRENTHTVIKDKFCLITINNFSGFD